MKFTILFVMVTGLFLPTYGAEKKVPQPSLTPKIDTSDRFKNLELFQKVLHFVENNYVDEVKQDSLIQGAIKGMLETLDPHSNFLNAETFRDMKIDTSGKFGGLGIEIGMRDGLLTVISPIEDTPAWKAGIKSNDRIIKIGGKSTKGLSLSDAVALMRGKDGSPVKISVYRKSSKGFKEFTLKREIIKIREVKFEELEPAYGYIRFATFSESVGKDVAAAIKKLEQNQKLKGLVLDLRNAPGGLLDQAVDVSSLFIDEGIVVSTIGRNRDKKEIKYARKGMARKDFNLAILVNSSTASAAEIVAGALQDHGRALVMGQPTFGKASVQTVIDLGNEMGLKLTIARYYTPSGRSIQERGVIPDLLLEEYDRKLLEKAKLERDSVRERDLPGHIVNEQKEDSDFSAQELDELIEKKGSSKDAKSEVGDDAPTIIVPKEDTQVREALNYIKSFEFFNKISLAKSKGSFESAPECAKNDPACKPK
jgi:carboxyl-terminal processing protease